MNWPDGFRASAAADSTASTASTSKKRPKTVFKARKAAAIPALEDRKSRRLTPSRRAFVRAVSCSSAATRACSGVCDSGTYSSFETTCVGSGESPSVSASSRHFRTHRRSCILVLLSALPACLLGDVNTGNIQMLTVSTPKVMVGSIVRQVEPREPQASRRPPRRPRRPNRYHHGDLPQALLDAALRIVKTQGTEALTLRAVARLAGVSQAAPYRHFANKEAILAAVAEDGFRSLMAAMRQSVQACGDMPLGRLRAVGIGYVTFATSHPSHFRVMFGRGMADRSAFPTLRQVASDTLAMVVAAIADCQRAGLVRAEEPAEGLALTAWSSVHGLSALLVEGVLDRPAAEVAEMVTRHLFLGLGVRQG